MNLKKIIPGIILSIFISKTGFAQDIIVTLDGDEIKSKVIEVLINEVKYKKYDNMNGPLYGILKSEVLMVKYENGLKDIFTPVKNNSTVNLSNSKTNKNAISFYAGLGMGSSRIENVTLINNSYDVKFKTSSQVSILFYYDLNKNLSFQSGVSTLFSRYSITQNHNGYNYEYAPTLMFVNLPINLNYKFAN